jgi:trimeric autotransporter adhesin
LTIAALPEYALRMGASAKARMARPARFVAVAGVVMLGALACSPVPEVGSGRTPVRDEPDASEPEASEPDASDLDASESDASEPERDASGMESDSTPKDAAPESMREMQETMAPSMCDGRPAGSEVCDGAFVRVCNEDGQSSSRQCGKQQRCVTIDGQASCVCVPGSVDQGNGCQVATNCEVDRGGCDTLTTCSISGDERVCSMCPDGYEGDGKQGCIPMLSALTAAGGELSPAFTPAVREYRVRLPLAKQQLALSLTAPEGVRIEVNGSEAPAGSAWTSPLLALGESLYQLRLTSSFGVISEYTLKVERTGMQTAYLKAGRSDRVDCFGSDLAVWGDTIVVGSVFEDSAAAGIDGDQSNNEKTDSGAAYVFVRSGDSWVQQAFLKSDAPAENEFFGVSVALWGDTVAVGASRASPWSNTEPGQGRVHVFTRDADRWQRQAILTAPDGADGDLFGFGLGLEGDRLIVGAPYEGRESRRSGATYVFERSAGAWGSPIKLKAENPVADESFGWAIAVEADTLAIGASHIDQLSESTPGTGAAYVFARDASGWRQKQRLQPPEPVDGDTFGWSLALYGQKLAIGAPRADLVRATPHGEAHLFELADDRWNLVRTLEAAEPFPSDYFGSAMALYEGGLLIGASGDPIGSRGFEGADRGGTTVAAGAVYMFGLQSDGWTRTTYFKASNSRRGVRFGEHVAIYGDTIAVSATGEDSPGMGVNGDQNSDGSTEAGAAYVFR